MNISSRGFLGLAVLSTVGAIACGGAGTSVASAEITDLHGDALPVAVVATSDGAPSQVAVGGRIFSITVSSDTSGPRVDCESEDGRESLALWMVGDELNVSATSESSSMTGKFHASGDRTAGLDVLRERVAVSADVESESSAMIVTLPLALYAAASWPSTADTSRALLDQLTTSLASWAPTYSSANAPAAVGELFYSAASAPSGPSCSGGGSSCSCAAGAKCTSTSSGCACTSKQ